MSKKVTEGGRDILSAYRLWLNNQVANEFSSDYIQLLAVLWRTEFFAEYANDENRAADAKALRDEFVSSIGTGIDIPGHVGGVNNADYLKLKATPVRLLEVMISLSKRISGIISVDANTDRYFWEMVSSLDLNKFDDQHFNVSIVQNRINNFFAHKYKRSGKGGLFFIKKIGPEYNAPMLDIWTQAMAWINYKGVE